MSNFDAVYARLREIMLDAAAGQVVSVDEPGNLVLRTAETDPKTGQPSWFGTVTIKKGYVAFHLMPLYCNPQLADGLLAELARRKQGKTCFNFKAVDEGLLAELHDLARRANAA